MVRHALLLRCRRRTLLLRRRGAHVALRGLRRLALWRNGRHGARHARFDDHVLPLGPPRLGAVLHCRRHALHPPLPARPAADAALALLPALGQADRGLARRRGRRDGRLLHSLRRLHFARPRRAAAQPGPCSSRPRHVRRRRRVWRGVGQPAVELRRGPVPQGHARHQVLDEDAGRHHLVRHAPRHVLRPRRPEPRHRLLVLLGVLHGPDPDDVCAFHGRHHVHSGRAYFVDRLLHVVPPEALLRDGRLGPPRRRPHVVAQRRRRGGLDCRAGRRRRPGRPRRRRELDAHLDHLLLGLVDLVGAVRWHLPRAHLQGPQARRVYHVHDDPAFALLHLVDGYLWLGWHQDAVRERAQPRRRLRLHRHGPLDAHGGALDGGQAQPGLHC
mmetsp:Transcript_30699/g.103441  ORF Transcript_30699/g.103441 Transcript_30699/m.103441 type:complete len:386 (-) Transcript_30699:1095-2252(-)